MTHFNITFPASITELKAFGVFQRTVLVLVAVAIVGGVELFWLYQSGVELEAARELERLGGNTVWAWRFDPVVQESKYPCHEPPQWILPGDSFVVSAKLLDCHQPSLDDKLSMLTSLSGIRSLSLAGTAISDSVMKHIAQLRGLESLSLFSTPVTDAGLPHLVR